MLEKVAWKKQILMLERVKEIAKATKDIHASLGMQ